MAEFRKHYVIPRHVTSSTHDADLKENNFRLTIHPQSFIAVAFIFSELGGIPEPSLRSRRSKKRGLDSNFLGAFLPILYSARSQRIIISQPLVIFDVL